MEGRADSLNAPLVWRDGEPVCETCRAALYEQRGVPNPMAEKDVCAVLDAWHQYDHMDFAGA